MIQKLILTLLTLFIGLQIWVVNSIYELKTHLVASYEVTRLREEVRKLSTDVSVLQFKDTYDFNRALLEMLGKKE